MPSTVKNAEKGQFKTGAKQVEIARMGGIASGKAKRARATLSNIARTVSVAPVPEKAKRQLEQMGIDDEDMTNSAMVVAGVFSRAIKGDTQAVEKWEQWTDVADKDNKQFELPARVIAKSFCDINREIVPNKTYIFEGGRGSTKSSFISLKIVELIKNNPMMHACVVREVGETMRDSVYAQLTWAISELGLDEEFKSTVSPLEITYKPTGQHIYFRGCDDPKKMKSIKPPFGYIGILWIEERDQLKGEAEERSVRQSVLRGGDMSYFFGSYNPPKSRSNWVNKQLLEIDDNRVVHHSDYRDVPKKWLGQMFIDDAEHLLAVNPSAYEHEYMGVPTGDGGNVFDNLEIREITDEEIEKFDKIYQGVDWGWYPDPFAFIRVYYDHAHETIYFIDEMYVNKMSNEKTANEIKKRKYDDFEIICDSAEPKSCADYRSSGLPAHEAIKGAGSVDYGMKWLQNRTIVIDPRRTPNAYKEFVNYEYERDKNGEVISGYPDHNNHLIDATRYALERVTRRFGSKA